MCSSLKTEENLRVASLIPLDRLLLETDAPWCDIRPTHASWKYLCESSAMWEDQWIQPVSYKKEKFVDGSMVKGRNEPCMMRSVLRVVSRLRGLPESDLSDIVWKNTQTLFFPHEL